MSLLQILQQGIQAKERAQQADIERGLRELQIGKEEKLQRDRLGFQGAQNKLDRQHELLKLSQQIAADRAEQMAGFAFEDQQRIKEEEFITSERLDTELFTDMQRREAEGFEVEMFDMETDRIEKQTKKKQDFVTSERIAGQKFQVKQSDKEAARQRRIQQEGQILEQLRGYYNDTTSLNDEIISGFMANAPTFTAENSEKVSKNIINNFKDVFKEAGFDKTVGENYGQTLVNALISAQAGNPSDIENVFSLLYDQTKVAKIEKGAGLQAYNQAQAIIKGFASVGFDTTDNFTNAFDVYLKNNSKKNNVLEEIDEFNVAKKQKGETDEQYWSRRYEIQRKVVGDRPTRENLAERNLYNQMLELAELSALATRDESSLEDRGFVWNANERRYVKDPKFKSKSSNNNIQPWQNAVEKRNNLEKKYLNYTKGMKENYSYAVDDILSRTVQELTPLLSDEQKKQVLGLQRNERTVGESTDVLAAIGLTSGAASIKGFNWRMAFETDYGTNILTHPKFDEVFDKYTNMLVNLEKGDYNWQKITSSMKAPVGEIERKTFIAKEIARAQDLKNKIKVLKSHYDKLTTSVAEEREAFDIWSKSINEK